MKQLICVLTCVVVMLVGCETEAPNQSEQPREVGEVVKPKDTRPDIAYSYKARERERVRMYWEIEELKQEVINGIDYPGRHADIATYIQTQDILLNGM